MFKVSANSQKNRLVIVLSGSVDVHEGEECVVLIHRELAKLKPGFDVITDFRHLRQAEHQAGPSLPRVMEDLLGAGVGRVVRVVGASREGLVNFAAFSKGVANYPAQYVGTMEDAERILAETKPAEPSATDTGVSAQ